MVKRRFLILLKLIIQLASVLNVLDVFLKSNPGSIEIYLFTPGSFDGCIHSGIRYNALIIPCQIDDPQIFSDLDVFHFSQFFFYVYPIYTKHGVQNFSPFHLETYKNKQISQIFLEFKYLTPSESWVHTCMFKRCLQHLFLIPLKSKLKFSLFK